MPEIKPELLSKGSKSVKNPQEKLLDLQLKRARLENRKLRKEIELLESSQAEEFGLDLNNAIETADYLMEKGFELIESPAGPKLILSAVFIYAWKEAYGDEFKLTDIPLGILYGFTIPDALKGGWVANSYAIGCLSALGLGFLDGFPMDEDSIGEWMALIGGPGGFALGQTAEWIIDKVKDSQVDLNPVSALQESGDYWGGIAKDIFPTPPGEIPEPGKKLKKI